MRNKMKDFIVIGSDHAGFKLKEIIKGFLIRKRSNIIDVGVYCTKPVDYPDIARKVANIVKMKEGSRGILICGSGTGMCIAANRFKGIRASVGYDTYSAKMSRKDNDANVLCLSGRKINTKKQLKIVDVWLKSGFSGSKRHKRRIKKLG